MADELKNVFIPEELFVTYREEQWKNPETKEMERDCILAFASPNGKDKAFQKRRDTQLSWAYGSYRSGFNYEETKDGELKFYKSVNRRYDEPIPPREYIELPEELAPKVLENKAMFGYRIAESVKRMYWGGGNVVWRIEDPRGFQLEIQSSNMAKIIELSRIDQGVIQDACIWARLGAHNILVPISTQLYKDVAKRSDQKKNIGNVSLKDVKPGFTVEVFNQKGQYRYYGSLNVIYTTQRGDYMHDGSGESNPYYRTFRFADTQKKMYVFKNLETGGILTLNSPKITSVIASEEISKQDAIDEINSNPLKGGDDWNSVLMCVTEKPINTQDVKVYFEITTNTSKLQFDTNKRWIDKKLFKLFSVYVNDTLFGISTTQGDMNWNHHCSYRGYPKAVYVPFTEDPIPAFELIVEVNGVKHIQDVSFRW